METLGRLVRTTKQRCKECNTTLQIRAREINIREEDKGILKTVPSEYLYCHKCEYEEELESKIKRKKKFERIELVEKEEPKKVWKSKSFDKDKKDGYSKPRFSKKG